MRAPLQRRTPTAKELVDALTSLRIGRPYGFKEGEGVSDAEQSANNALVARRMCTQHSALVNGTAKEGVRVKRRTYRLKLALAWDVSVRQFCRGSPLWDAALKVRSSLVSVSVSDHRGSSGSSMGSC